MTLGRAGRIVAEAGSPGVNRGHLLQALLSHIGGSSHVALRTIRANRGVLLAKAEQWARETEAVAGPRAFGTSAWGILGAAWEEAERQGLGHVGTGHLLYGLLASAEGRLGSLMPSSLPSASSVRAVLDHLLR